MLQKITVESNAKQLVMKTPFLKTMFDTAESAGKSDISTIAWFLAHPPFIGQDGQKCRWRKYIKFAKTEN